MSKENKDDKASTDSSKTTPEQDKLPEGAEIIKLESLGAELPTPSGESMVDVIAAPEIPEKRGRGRPAGSKSHKKGHGVGAKSKASAETVVSGLDMLRDWVSNGTCQDDIDRRKQVVAVWEAYFMETGLEPPLWVLVTVTSIGYVVPALKTEKAKGKISGLITKVQAWRLNREADKKL
jgi:hypothetical protein